MTFRPKSQKRRPKKVLSDDFETVELLATAFQQTSYPVSPSVNYAIFAEVMGRNFVCSSPSDISLWDDAWALARRNREVDNSK